MADYATEAEIVRALVQGNEGLWVPCSRYGRTTEECAPVAARLALFLAAEDGRSMASMDEAEYAMGLVVNNHDDVASILNDYCGADWPTE